jgi:hypothetical protein
LNKDLENQENRVKRETQEKRENQEKSGGKDSLKNMRKNPASKFEEFTRETIERSLPGYKFPSVYPDWLVGTQNQLLELDGYNQELKIAFEAQGPLHFKFTPKQDKSYAHYYKRLINDKIKRDTCKKQGVHLIIVDYLIPKHQISNYINSRLWDIYQLTNDERLKYTQPSDHIPVIIHDVYRNPKLEEEMNLIGI